MVLCFSIKIKYLSKQLKDISFSKYIGKEMTTKHDYIFDLMSEIQSEMEEGFLNDSYYDDLDWEREREFDEDMREIYDHDISNDDLKFIDQIQNLKKQFTKTEFNNFLKERYWPCGRCLGEEGTCTSNNWDGDWEFCGNCMYEEVYGSNCYF